MINIGKLNTIKLKKCYVKKNSPINRLGYMKDPAQFLRALILNLIPTLIVTKDKRTRNYCNRILNPKY